MGLRRGSRAALIGCALAGYACMPALAERSAALQVSEAWARPTPRGTSVGAVYLSIQNSGAVADRLLAASSPLAAKVEFHQTTQSGGVISMRVVSFIECPPGVTVRVLPGALHIMLLGLKTSLVPGTSFPLTLQFRDAGSVIVDASVQVRE